MNRSLDITAARLENAKEYDAPHVSVPLGTVSSYERVGTFMVIDGIIYYDLDTGILVPSAHQRAKR
jgi:hypothetical protein